MKKTNIRSIRFSDRLARLIEQQIGNTFTEKFELLIERCVWEQPQKEAELARLDREISRKKEQLQEMSDQARELGATINELFPRVRALEAAIDRANQKWNT